MKVTKIALSLWYMLRIIFSSLLQAQGSLFEQAAMFTKFHDLFFKFFYSWIIWDLLFKVEAIKSGMQPGLTMVVGPPGTGKTDVAVQIISNIYHNWPEQRTLIVTHSNQALNQLFEKIMALDVDERHLLRLGKSEAPKWICENKSHCFCSKNFSLAFQNTCLWTLNFQGHGEEALETEKDFSRYGRVNYVLMKRLELLKEVCLVFSKVMWKYCFQRIREKLKKLGESYESLLFWKYWRELSENLKLWKYKRWWITSYSLIFLQVEKLQMSLDVVGDVAYTCETAGHFFLYQVINFLESAKLL